MGEKKHGGKKEAAHSVAAEVIFHDAALMTDEGAAFIYDWACKCLDDFKRERKNFSNKMTYRYLYKK